MKVFIIYPILYITILLLNGCQLVQYGIAGTPLKWFDSYFKGRTQSVNIGGILSDPRSLDEGVPQGSVLGPSVFSTNIAPVGDIVTAHGISYMSYADDTPIYVT